MQLIFDIGMFTGDDTAYYLNKGYRVIAVEANPVLAKAGTEKFSDYIKNGSLTIINKGIAEKQGECSFWVNKANGEWSSFNKEMAIKWSPDVHEVKVETTNLNELFKTYGVPFFLKIDIEGMDIFCLKSIDANNKPRYVSCEVGELEMLEILQAKGYTKFKMINQASGFSSFSAFKEVFFVPSLIEKIIWKIKKKAFKSSIPYGNSGYFGEDTKGQWKSFEEIKRDYKTYYKKDGEPINRLSWYDFHATF